MANADSKPTQPPPTEAAARRSFGPNPPMSEAQKSYLLRASILLSLALAIIGIVAFFTTWPITNPLIWIANITTLVVSLISGLCALLCIRSHHRIAISFLFVSFFLGSLIESLIVAGGGIALGVSVAIFVLIFAPLTLSGRRAVIIVLIGIGVAIVVVLIDLLGIPGRPSLPQNYITVISVAVGLVGLLAVVFLATQFASYSLIIKLIVPFVAVALMAIGIQAVFNYYSTDQALRNAENEKLYAAAAQTAVKIDSYIDTTKNTLSAEASLSAFRMYLLVSDNKKRYSVEENTASLTLYSMQSRGNVLSYSLLTPDGKPWIDSATPLSQIDRIPRYLGIDKTDPNFFQDTIQAGEARLSPVIFQPNTNQAEFYIAVPIIEPDGRPIGMLIGRYYAQIFQTLVSQNTGLAGDQSYPVLLDDNHLRLAHGKEVSLVYKLVTPLSNIETLKQTSRIPNLIDSELSTDLPGFEAELSQPQTARYFTAIEGSESTGQETDLVAVEHLSNAPAWIVAYMQPEIVALAPIQNQLRFTIITTVVIAILATLAAYLIARQLTSPISRLTLVAEKVTAGDLTVRAAVDSKDEIGTLSQAFNTMTSQLRQTLEGLEQRIAIRTSELAEVSRHNEYRANQLQTIAEISHAIASLQEPEQLLPQVTHLIGERFNFYHVGIFLVDPKGEYAVLQAANSEGGKRMLTRSHRLRVGQTGIVGYVTAHGEARISLDVGKDAVFFDNPDLPSTRSEMALPLKVGERIIGALDVQSEKSSAFTEEDITLLSALADQTAIAIENTRLFSETRNTLADLQIAQRQYLQQAWSKVTTEQQMGGFRYAYGKLSSLPPAVSKTSDMLDIWHAMDSGKTTIMTPLPDAPALETRPLEDTGSNSALVVPITLRGVVIGLINLEDTENPHPWTDDEVSLIKSVADQVGLALENARLIEETQRRAEREHTVAEITSRMRASNDPQQIMQMAVSELRQALGVKTAQVTIQPIKPPAANVQSPIIPADEAMRSDDHSAPQSPSTGENPPSNGGHQGAS